MSDTVQLELILRRALRRAGIVQSWLHKCRRLGCGHVETAQDDGLRRCTQCRMKLWPSGQVRPLRFHHLRHTTASLLLMAGADLPAVQKILRHTDPRMTTETYGPPRPGLPALSDRPALVRPHHRSHGESRDRALATIRRAHSNRWHRREGARQNSASVCSYFAPGVRKPRKGG